MSKNSSSFTSPWWFGSSSSIRLSTKTQIKQKIFTFCLIPATHSFCTNIQILSRYNTLIFKQVIDFLIDIFCLKFSNISLFIDHHFTSRVAWFSIVIFYIVLFVRVTWTRAIVNECRRIFWHSFIFFLNWYNSLSVMLLICFIIQLLSFLFLLTDHLFCNRCLTLLFSFCCDCNLFIFNSFSFSFFFGLFFRKFLCRLLFLLLFFYLFLSSDFFCLLFFF